MRPVSFFSFKEFFGHETGNCSNGFCLWGDRTLNKQLLKDAVVKIPNIPVLVNAVSKRVKQLYAGHRPYLKPLPNEEAEDIALREIAEGKLTVEIDFSAVAEKARRDKARQK